MSFKDEGERGCQQAYAATRFRMEVRKKTKEVQIRVWPQGTDTLANFITLGGKGKKGGNSNTHHGPSGKIGVLEKYRTAAGDGRHQKKGI